jgi:hypothetical protein
LHGDRRRGARWPIAPTGPGGPRPPGSSPAGPPDQAHAPATGERHAVSHEPTAARTATVEEPELERQGRVLGATGWRFLVLGLLAAVPGGALVVFTDGWAMAIGIAVLALAGCPAVVGAGLLLSSLVTRWSARHKLFA